MKPAPFLYVAPDTVEEALALLRQHGTEAKVLAGGQSLVPLMNLRLARPAVLVDVNRIAGHDRVRDGGRHVAIGFLVRQRAFETSPELARRIPLLAEALSFVAHPAIRSRGTIAGSIAHADPAAEIPAVATALDGEIVLRAKGHKRVVAAGDFFVDVLTTVLEPTELVTELRIPRPPTKGTAFLEVARRHGDFALVGVAAVVRTAADGSIASARLVLAGVAGKPVRAVEAEQMVVGHQPSVSLFSHAGRAAAAPLAPPSDLHATAAYRLRLAAILTARALSVAARRAGVEVTGA
jgi:carbon-monoxide dehydrogenase medium subunit